MGHFPLGRALKMEESDGFEFVNDFLSDREHDIEDSSDGELGGPPKKVSGPKGLFKFRSRLGFLTYSQSRISDPERFYDQIRDKLPEGTEIFGCQERHQETEGVHYHVLIQLEKRPNWKDGRGHFQLTGDDGEPDTDAIRIKPRSKRQSVASFLENVQDYIMKGEPPLPPVLFGKQILPPESVGQRRKRIYSEVLETEDPDDAERLLRREDPVSYLRSFASFSRYFDQRRRKLALTRASRVQTISDGKPWCVYPEMLAWKQEFIDQPRPGRKPPLVLVGKPMTGKTLWSLHFGNPARMDTTWNMSVLLQPGLTHVVISDCDIKTFGPKDHPMWKAFLGCQERVSAYCRYHPTLMLELGLPCIWTCNYDQDPRRFKPAREYLEQIGAVIVEVDRRLFE